MPTELAVTFDEMTVLTEEGVDVFVLNLDAEEDVPPFYIDVAGRRFAYTGATFLVKGHSALLPRFLREEEAAGRIVILGERDERYYAYVHDAAAPADED